MVRQHHESAVGYAQLLQYSMTHLRLLVLEVGELRPSLLRHPADRRVVRNGRVQGRDVLRNLGLILQFLVPAEAVLQDKHTAKKHANRPFIHPASHASIHPAIRKGRASGRVVTS